MFGLSAWELVIIAVVAVLVFGPRLPQVAAEAAGWMIKLKRGLTELRRESGIDRELDEVRRQVENSIPREVRRLDVERSVREGAQAVAREIAEPIAKELEAARDAATKDRREDELNPAAPDPQAPPAATDRPA